MISLLAKAIINKRTIKPTYVYVEDHYVNIVRGLTILDPEHTYRHATDSSIKRLRNLLGSPMENRDWGKGRVDVWLV
jgi:hypothetical protein